MNMLAVAEAADHALAEEMDRYVFVKSTLYTSGERDPRLPPERVETRGKLHLMDHDPRLTRMPERPTLFDFFKHRFGPATHMLQSARLAQKNGASEKIVLACLIHDIANIGFIRADHGYWAAQLIEPYVDEEVTFAVRYHQVLRFFPDEASGYLSAIVRPALRRRLQTAGASPARPRRCTEAQVLRLCAASDGERSVRLRSGPRCGARGIHGRGRPPFPAARGRTRIRSEPVRAHVAHDQLAVALPLIWAVRDVTTA